MSLLVGMMVMAMTAAPVEKPISFIGAGEFELFGTLTMPSNATGHLVPGVVLLPGSGPTDRDGNQAPLVVTDLLKQIATTLAEAGIASVRFDKRATPLYYAKWPKDRDKWAEFFKWENFVDDATDAYRYLCAHQGIDGHRVAILGHSEGAEIALQIGSNLAKDPTPPAALVTLGGAGRKMGPILREQIVLRLDQSKMLAPTKRKYMDYLDKAISQVIQDASFPPDPPAGFESLFNASTSKLMQSYCTIDPAQLAKRYAGPVLLINGGQDQQISPERDTPLLKAALESRSKGTVETLIVPDASHNLKSTVGGNKDQMTGPVAPLALSKIQQFLVKELRP